MPYQATLPKFEEFTVGESPIIRKPSIYDQACKRLIELAEAYDKAVEDWENGRHPEAISPHPKRQGIRISFTSKAAGSKAVETIQERVGEFGWRVRFSEPFDGGKRELHLDRDGEEDYED